MLAALGRGARRCDRRRARPAAAPADPARGVRLELRAARRRGARPAAAPGGVPGRLRHRGGRGRLRGRRRRPARARRRAHRDARRLRRSQPGQPRPRRLHERAALRPADDGARLPARAARAPRRGGGRRPADGGGLPGERPAGGPVLRGAAGRARSSTGWSASCTTCARRSVPSCAPRRPGRWISPWTSPACGRRATCAEGRAWVQRALAAGGDELAPATRASGLWTAAMLAHYQGDYEAERPLAVASLAAARVADDPLTLARALYVEALSVVTDAPGATARYREVLALCERLGDDAGIAMACNDLGELARGAGALDEARALYERALGLWRAGGDQSGVSRAAHNLGQTMLARGELDRAAALLLESLEASRGIGDRSSGRRGPGGPGGGGRRTGAEHRRRHAARRGAGGARRRRGRARPDSTRSRFALRSRRCARRWATSASPRRSRAAGRWATTSAGASSSAWSPVAPEPPSGVLTRRELEVVRLIAAGLTNAEIAAAPGGQRPHGAPPRVQHPGQARRALARRRGVARGPARPAVAGSGPDGPSRAPAARMARPGEVAERRARGSVLVIQRARGAHATRRGQGHRRGVHEEKRRQIVEGLTEAMVAIEGEGLRGVTWVLVEEVRSGEWGSGLDHHRGRPALAAGVAS